MIPYFQFTQFHIGPIPIQVWGLCVAIGILIGVWVAVRVAKHRKLKAQAMIDIGFWSIAGAMLGARVLFVLSEWSSYMEEPGSIVKVWEGGMSVSGGFIGAVLAAIIYTKVKKINFIEYAEAAVIGLPVGLFLGRIGCFLIHDHPGTPTDFFLGQEFSDEAVRHNHGLYLSLNGLFMALTFALLWKRNPNRKRGFYSIIFLIWYGIVRFGLDFFRAYDVANADARIGGLTWAQYVALFMVVGGGVLWYYVYRKRANNSK